MAYDQNERERREQRSRFDEQRRDPRERGFFERARDEVLSWSGDEDAERRRAMDERSGDRDDGGRRFYGRQERGPARDEDTRSYGARTPDRGDSWRLESGRGDFARRAEVERERGAYRPLAGDYGRASDDYYEHAPTSRRGSAATGAGAGATAAHDRHYSEWRQRQIDELDRDYDEYRREHQSKFESDFSNWRSTRQSKRQLLGSIREHMQVFGSDEQPVGTVDKVRGDRIILTKGDAPDARHHSINCAMIDRVEGDRVLLDRKAEEAKAAFGTEERDRALYERDDQREPGAHILDRSFSGTY